MSTIILAIDSSSTVGSVAIIKDEEILAEKILTEGLKHGRLLLPAVAEVIDNAGITRKELSFIAAGVGPGSYTGTRVGVMAAKAIAFGLGIKTIPISSLAALAMTASESNKKIIPLQDARRDEVYTAVYTINEAGLPVAELDDIALTPEETAKFAVDENYIIAGSAITRYPDIFEPLTARGLILKPEITAPSAADIARIAYANINAAIDAKEMQPTYMRRDDAPCTFERFMENPKSI